jgi:UDP-N-acetylglucosamine 2-epimerase (non-hydrolysing)
VEAGLRSFDRTMPEEINRLLTDQIADLLFTPSVDGDENLEREGIAREKIHMVGNCMIDTLLRLLKKAEKPKVDNLTGPFALVTLHRPSNVDKPETLAEIIRTLAELSKDIQIVFPMHPRTRGRLESFHLQKTASDLLMIDPQGYLEFLWLQQHATMILTDSGGVQEEATFLKVPCLTLRQTTERPVTCNLGTNILVGSDMDRLKTAARQILKGTKRSAQVPPLWDGRAGERVAAKLAEYMGA